MEVEGAAGAAVAVALSAAKRPPAHRGNTKSNSDSSGSSGNPLLSQHCVLIVATIRATGPKQSERPIVNMTATDNS